MLTLGSFSRFIWPSSLFRSVAATQIHKPLQPNGTIYTYKLLIICSINGSIWLYGMVYLYCVSIILPVAAICTGMTYPYDTTQKIQLNNWTNMPRRVIQYNLYTFKKITLIKPLNLSWVTMGVSGRNKNILFFTRVSFYRDSLFPPRVYDVPLTVMRFTLKGKNFIKVCSLWFMCQQVNVLIFLIRATIGCRRLVIRFLV